MNYRLIIFLCLAIFPGVSLSDADGPDYWRVTGISDGDSLNIRKGPSIRFSIIGSIPHNAVDISNGGCFPSFNASEWDRFNLQEQKEALRLRWCKIRFNNISGWVYSKYLEE